MPIPPEIADFYALYDEAGRLESGYFPLERERTREILLRHLPAPPAVVLDVGGAAGGYAFWLAGLGYAVHLVDPVPALLERARARARSPGESALAGIHEGDARALAWPAGSADVVLLLGPLYHLAERADRLRALAEARRVSRPGGVVAVAAISRFASLLDWLGGPLAGHPDLARIVASDLATGQHRNPTENLHLFTTAYFHHPSELREEVEQAGLALVDLLPVEGLGAFAADFPGTWADPERRRRLLDFLRSVEREGALLGASPHLLAVARRRA
jgi:ubiquinone/menaquinone biosynthesis C-methylase UbiE